MTRDHRITELRSDDDAGDAFWRCGCGEFAEAYSSVAEARYAAAEHQLPDAIQRDIEATTDSIEQWRDAVLIEADAAAEADPEAWRWYREPEST